MLHHHTQLNRSETKKYKQINTITMIKKNHYIAQLHMQLFDNVKVYSWYQRVREERSEARIYRIKMQI